MAKYFIRLFKTLIDQSLYEWNFFSTKNLLILI